MIPGHCEGRPGPILPYMAIPCYPLYSPRPNHASPQMSILFGRESPHIPLRPHSPFCFSPAPSPSPSPTLTSSMPSTPPDPTPSPEFIDVICNAPLVAPIPLPYLSPTFLQFHHHLPVADDDYFPPDAFSPHNNPPRVPAKRKRAEDELVSFALLIDTCAFSPDYPPAKRLARWPSSCRPVHRLPR